MHQNEKPRACPGCGRARSTCWHLPCLYLEIVLRRGGRAVESWVRAGVPGELRSGVSVERRAP